MSRHVDHKRLVREIGRALDEAPGEAEIAAVLAGSCHPDAPWSCSQPLNDLPGPAEVAERLLLPLRRAMPDVERRDDILLAGRFAEADWVTATGHYVGTFERPLFGIPPTGGPPSSASARSSRSGAAGSGGPS